MRFNITSRWQLEKPTNSQSYLIYNQKSVKNSRLPSHVMLSHQSCFAECNKRYNKILLPRKYEFVDFVYWFDIFLAAAWLVCSIMTYDINIDSKSV